MDRLNQVCETKNIETDIWCPKKHVYLNNLDLK